MNEPPTTPQPPANAAPPDLVAPAVIATLLTGVCFVTVGAFFQVLNVPVGMWFTELAIFLALPLLTLRGFSLDPVRTTGLDAAFLPGIAYGFALGVVNFFAVAAPLQWLALKVFPKALTELFDASVIFRNLSGPELWATVLAVTVAAPVCEEVAFRGVINRALLQKFRPWAAVLLGGFIFSAFHLDPVGLAARWALGALFGWLAWRSGSIWPGVAAHAANNLTSMVLYLLSPDQADASATASDVASTFVVAGVALSVLLQLPRRFPRLLEGPRRAETTPGRPLNLPRAVGGWLFVAVFLASLVLGLDPNGVKLGFIDATPPQLRFDDPKDPDLKALTELRKKARRGEAPVDAYRDLRKQLIEKHRKGEATRPSPGIDAGTPVDAGTDLDAGTL